MALQPGQTFDRYAVEELVGEGGMGRVYRAFDTRLQRSVALKVLHAADGDAAEAVALALREARAAAAIAHPNATAIYDAHEVEGTSFIAMEFVAGRSLRVLLGGPSIPLATRLRWLIDVAGALEAAHRMGVVHRDVKPENVMVRHDGLVKVLDFGVARRASTTGDAQDRPPSTPDDAPILAVEPPPGAFAGAVSEARVAGTPAYMAPEQIQGQEIDGRADQFAWGVLAYEMLTGRLPWRTAKNPLGYIAAVVSEDPLPPGELIAGIPREVDATVLRALSKSPGDRFPTMRAAAAPLLRFARQSLSMVAVQLPRRRGRGRARSGGRESAEADLGRPGLRSHRAALRSGPGRGARARRRRSPSPPAPRLRRTVAVTRPAPPSSRRAPADPPPASSGRRLHPSQAPEPGPQSSGARARAGTPGRAPRPRRPFGPGFHEPDFEGPVDVDAHLAQVPPGATVKGLFFGDLLAQTAKVTAEHEVFRLAQLPAHRYVGFRDYPLAENLRLVVAAAHVLYPRYALGEGLRRIGQTMFDAVLATHIGRSLFGVLGRDVEPILLTGPKAFGLLISVGTVTAEKSAFRTFTFHASAFPVFLETYHVGVLEGVLRHCGERGRIRIAMEDLGRATVELRLL